MNWEGKRQGSEVSSRGARATWGWQGDVCNRKRCHMLFCGVVGSHCGSCSLGGLGGLNHSQYIGSLAGITGSTVIGFVPAVGCCVSRGKRLICGGRHLRWEECRGRMTTLCGNEAL